MKKNNYKKLKTLIYGMNIISMMAMFAIALTVFYIVGWLPILSLIYGLSAIAGFAVLLASIGSIFYFKAYGKSDRALNEIFTNSTQFNNFETDVNLPRLIFSISNISLTCLCITLFSLVATGVIPLQNFILPVLAAICILTNIVGYIREGLEEDEEGKMSRFGFICRIVFPILGFFTTLISDVNYIQFAFIIILPVILSPIFSIFNIVQFAKYNRDLCYGNCAIDQTIFESLHQTITTEHSKMIEGLKDAQGKNSARIEITIEQYHFLESIFQASRFSVDDDNNKYIATFNIIELDIFKSQLDYLKQEITHELAVHPAKKDVPSSLMINKNHFYVLSQPCDLQCQLRNLTR